MDDPVPGTPAPPPGGVLGRTPCPQSQVFEVVIAGTVSPALLPELEDVEVLSHELGTVLSGRFDDQASLLGLLSRLRGFALEIVEVRRVVEPAAERERRGDQ